LIGLYVHVPFCAAICNYCNFNRGLFDEALKARYVDALVREIEGGERLRPARGERVFERRSASERGWGPASSDESRERLRPAADTIYFGGGTPSLLDPEDVARVVAACEGGFDVARGLEVTLEANPESITVDRLRGYRDAGVTRLSIGVQSFRDDELTRLSRLHDAAGAATSVDVARQAGFDNVSLDLMMWLPGQSVRSWLESVDRAVGLGPDHLSLYLLEVYPNAPLREEMARAHWSQAPDEDAAAMYLTALERLDAAGYVQYEISNVARPGRVSRHNIKYWTDGEWLGFGCGAHSTRGGVRWKNVASTEEYVAAVRAGRSPAVEHRTLSPDERLGDALFTGLRLVEGVDLDFVGRRYRVDVWDRFGPALTEFVDAGILVRESARLRLSRQGMLLANEVMAVFV
jgi:oxygen-independent coproporphyrinogen-3 oxidase